MIGAVVCVGGPPGSGKSTASRLVAERFGLTYASAGDTFRAEARSHGLDLEAFGRYAEEHPEIDRALDLRMQALARPGYLLDGRIQGALCRRAGTRVHYVIVTAREEERVRRVAQRDGLALEEAARRVRLREASERARYHAFYGIEIDLERPDLLVDSTLSPATEVAGAIARHIERREREP